jgi:hypothetical protein
MRYIDKQKKIELLKGVHDLSGAVELDPSNPFFHPIPEGKVIKFDVDGVPFLADYTPLDMGVIEAGASISALYVQAMNTLKNGYTQSEIDTFPMKQAAMDAYYSGSSTEDNWHLSYLAGLEGATGEESQPDLDAIILSRAEKIKTARDVFWSVSSKLESIRNKYYDQLSDGQDNSQIVESLKSDYIEFGAIIE